MFICKIFVWYICKIFVWNVFEIFTPLSPVYLFMSDLFVWEPLHGGQTGEVSLVRDQGQRPNLQQTLFQSIFGSKAWASPSSIFSKVKKTWASPPSMPNIAKEKQPNRPVTGPLYQAFTTWKYAIVPHIYHAYYMYGMNISCILYVFVICIWANILLVWTLLQHVQVQTVFVWYT